MPNNISPRSSGARLNAKQYAAFIADKKRVDKLAAMWDSQGKGHHLMGRWFPNTTGSFRDAIDAYKPKA